MTAPTTKFYRNFPDHPICSFLPATALVLLADLYWHRNRQTGQLNPRLETLAKNRGWSYAKIRRVMAILRDCGIVRAIRGRRASSYEIRPTAEWHRPVCRERSEMSTLKPPRVLDCERSEMSTLNLPFLTERETVISEEEDAAGAVVPTSSSVATEAPKAAAAAAGGVLENIPTPTQTPEPATTVASEVQALVLELAPNHPQPGNVHRAAPVLEGILRAAKDRPATIAQIRSNHQAWRLYWNALPAGRFIPQLHRWFRDGDWVFAPGPEAVAALNREVERKPLTRAERIDAACKRLEAKYAANERSVA